MKRTVETASIIAAPHSLDARCRRSACARSITADGKAERAPEVERQFSDEYQRVGTGPVHLRARTRRMRARRDGSRASRHPPHRRSHAGDNVVVVSHKATIGCSSAACSGFDARGYRDRLDQAPACLNVLDFKDPVRARLMLFNDISHYGEHPRRPQRPPVEVVGPGKTPRRRA